MKKTRLTAVICAAAITAALTGCGKDSGGDASIGSSAGTGATMINEATTREMPEMVTETRPLEEGDDYAINKINPRTAEAPFPGGYGLTSYSEENQGKLYANGKSKVEIRAYNYKEDLQDLATWADQACAIIKVGNFTSAIDTEFGEPENTTLYGFDAIKYEYLLTQYEFIENEEDPDGKEIKSPIGRYKGIAYYFYSDQDAYAISFDSAEDDFEEQSANFQAFMEDLEITKTEY